jgi:hypothetical protein
LSIAQPANLATPELAARGLLVHVSVPGPPEVGVPLVMARVTDAVLLVTLVPFESSTQTTGCVVHAVSAVPPFGCGAMKTSWDAGPITVIEAPVVPTGL